MNTAAQNALCLAAVWHYGDGSIFSKATGIDTFCRAITPAERRRAKAKEQATAKALREAGIDMQDADAVAEAYNALVLDLAADLRPDLSERYDYWGGRCLSDSKAWGAPKAAHMAGNDARAFLPCTDVDTIKAELSRNLDA